MRLAPQGQLACDDDMERVRRHCQRWLRTHIESLSAWWREPEVLPRPTRAGIEFALHPSRLLRWSTGVFLCSTLAYAVELLLLGQLLMGAGVCTIAAVCAAHWRRSARQHHDAPRRLLITSDGRLYLSCVNGQLIPIELHASTMQLGQWTLVVVRREQQLWRWLLGPDNVEPKDLAGLRRRLLSLRNERVGASRLGAGGPTKTPGQAGRWMGA